MATASDLMAAAIMYPYTSRPRSVLTRSEHVRPQQPGAQNAPEVDERRGETRHRDPDNREYEYLMLMPTIRIRLVF
jgi:hypothetical protein